MFILEIYCSPFLLFCDYYFASFCSYHMGYNIFFAPPLHFFFQVESFPSIFWFWSAFVHTLETQTGLTHSLQLLTRVFWL